MPSKRTTRSESKPMPKAKPSPARAVKTEAPARSTKAVRKPEAPMVMSSRSGHAAVMAMPTHDQIAIRAYERFEMRGCEHGFHMEDWLAAEAELNHR